MNRLVIAVTVAGAMLLAERMTGQEVVRPAFNPRRLMPAMRPIVDPPMLDADRVTDQVDDNELVLGVVVGGQARAYPINMLTGPSREIINDTLGGRAIAATW